MKKEERELATNEKIKTLEIQLAKNSDNGPTLILATSDLIFTRMNKIENLILL